MRAFLLGLLLTGSALATLPAATSNLRPAAPLVQDTVQAGLERAFWLEEHEGATHEAKALYEAIASDARASDAVRAKARGRAQALNQDLLAEDLTQLLPADTLLYAELSQPGEHLAALLEALGIYGRPSETGAFGVSPELVQGLLGAKGAAFAVTHLPLDGGMPSGVLVVHPGDLAVVRGLLETALPARALPAASIEGYATWSLPIEQGLALSVTMTERLLIASTDAHEIGAVIERMNGHDPASLASNAELAHALEGRGDALLSVCVNAQPLLPMIRQLGAQLAKQDPQAAMALAFLDVESLRSLSVHLAAGALETGGNGIALDVELELAEGHQNLVFDLLRRPNVQRDTLALVPAGAAFALATALNPEAKVAPLHTDAHGRPVVSLLDLGRELFSNVVDVALYGLPPESGYQGGLPDVALVVRANDTSRTRALFDLALDLASRATQGAGGVHELVAGVEATRYSIQGLPLFVASENGRVVLSPSRAAIARSIDAANGRDSILSDPLFEPELAAVDGSDTLLMLVSPARCARMAAPFVPGSEGQQLGPIADLMEGSVLSVGMVHDDTRLGLHACMRSLPDVSDLVTRALRGEDPLGGLRSGTRASGRSTAALVRIGEELVEVAVDSEASIRED